MKFAFSTLACPDWSVEQVAAAAANLGYDGVELRLLDGELIDPIRDHEKVAAAVARCREAGIEVRALDTSCRFNQSDDDERERQIAAARAWIALARAVQVPLLRVFGGEDPEGMDRREGTSAVAAALARLGPTAEAAGVTVALETHDAFASAHRVADVLSAVPSPAIAALWDSHHPYRVGESPDQVLDLLGARLAHVHVKDARRPTAGSPDWQLVLLGEGEVPVREMLRALARRGYAGWVSVEWEKKWHPEIPDPEIALPQHIAWLRGLAL